MKQPKPVRAWAFVNEVGKRICWGEPMFKTKRDVLEFAPNYTSGRWIRVEIRPLPARRRKKAKRK